MAKTTPDRKTKPVKTPAKTKKATQGIPFGVGRHTMYLGDHLFDDDDVFTPASKTKPAKTEKATQTPAAEPRNPAQDGMIEASNEEIDYFESCTGAPITMSQIIATENAKAVSNPEENRDKR